MIIKIAALIAAGAGGWLGYQYADDVMNLAGATDEDYWAQQGSEFLHIALTAGSAIVCGVATYFLLNFFRRFD